MKMLPVLSTSIHSVGHDGDSTMRVQFIGGGLYEHHSVSAAQFQALLAAPSVGKHYATHHRGINYRKVGG